MRTSPRSTWCVSALVLFFAAISLTPTGFAAQNLVNEALPHPPAPSVTPTILIGFVGGRVRHDDPNHAEVQLAERLHREYPKELEVRVFENRHEEQAYRLILHSLDSDHDGRLSAAEKQRARIILYGHSWGGSAVVTLARALARDRVPVLLTVQIDSVAKIGENDRVLPANVERGVNFYQPDGLIHGASLITAADPSRTQILGNFRFDYHARPVACPGYPWYDYYLYRAHTEIECDPRVWSQVETLIRDEISSPVKNLATTAAPQ
ncbi:MAG TPA: hypothetical protein VMJ93_12685 [Verrucomicrobiae bacterium]|nr:hypothetical protein [Verrucomicrobiae bacterium]